MCSTRTRFVDPANARNEMVCAPAFTTFLALTRSPPAPSRRSHYPGRKQAFQDVCP